MQLRNAIFPKRKSYDILICVATPIQARKGGLTYGSVSIVYYLCRGKCSCLLHLQMVGWREVIGNQPRA